MLGRVLCLVLRGVGGVRTWREERPGDLFADLVVWRFEGVDEGFGETCLRSDLCLRLHCV